MNGKAVLIRMFVVLGIVGPLLLAGCGGGTGQSLNNQPPNGAPPTAVGAGTFTPAGNMITARAVHTATLLPNGKVLIAGGAGDGGQPLASAELYDPVTGTSTSTGSMITARTWGHTATLLANGKVLIVGGSSSRQTYQPVASAEIYDPVTGTFTTSGSMTAAQRVYSAVLLGNGMVFIAAEDHAELYDPATGSFTLSGSYVDPTPAVWGPAILLLNGRVLLTGCSTDCSQGATELYDPGTETFSHTGPMHGWDNVNTATLLADGTVLFVGNVENDGIPAEAELYDPGAAAFKALGHALAPHEFSAAVRLSDGQVLITGGQLPGGNGNADAELFLPATGTFALAGRMVTGRHSHTATLLPDGTVLIAGGYTIWPIPTSTAELFRPAATH